MFRCAKSFAFERVSEKISMGHSVREAAKFPKGILSLKNLTGF